MERPVAERSALYCPALALLLLASLSAFLGPNDYPVFSFEVGLLVLGGVLAGAFLALLAHHAGRGVAAIVLGGVLAFCIDLLFGLKGHKPLIVIVPIASVALAWLLRRQVATIVLAASAMLLVSTLLLPVSGSRGVAAIEPMAHTAPAAARDAPPVLLHLILDEHIGIDGIPRDIGTDNDFAEWLTTFYSARGFRLYADAYSEYFNTQISISKLLNFDSDGDAGAHLIGDGEPYVLKDSAYFRDLARRGYRLHVYESDYMDFCRVPGIPYVSCTIYSGHKIGAIHRAPLAKLQRAEFILNSLLSRSYYLHKARQGYQNARQRWPGLNLPAWGAGTSRVGPLPVLPVLRRLEADLRHARRGDAYFAHLLIPHYPYVLDAACTLRGDIDDWLYSGPAVPASQYALNTPQSRASRYSNYFAQIRCQQQLIERLFEALKAAGMWRDAIVVIHGDHGSRIVQHLPVPANAARLTATDLRDAFSTLFALRAPGIAPGVVNGNRPIQSLLGRAIGIEVPPIAPRVYLRSDGGALVTHRLPRSWLARSADGEPVRAVPVARH